jgi:hypothetical protein
MRESLVENGPLLVEGHVDRVLGAVAVVGDLVPGSPTLGCFIRERLRGVPGMKQDALMLYLLKSLRMRRVSSVPANSPGAMMALWLAGEMRPGDIATPLLVSLPLPSPPYEPAIRLLRGGTVVRTWHLGICVL